MAKISIFIQLGIKIRGLDLIIFQLIHIPPKIENGDRVNMPLSILLSPSSDKNIDSDFIRLNKIKNLMRQE